jgi:hypothetical protein
LRHAYFGEEKTAALAILDQAGNLLFNDPKTWRNHLRGQGREAGPPFVSFVFLESDETLQVTNVVQGRRVDAGYLVPKHDHSNVHTRRF